MGLGALWRVAKGGTALFVEVLRSLATALVTALVPLTLLAILGSCTLIDLRPGTLSISPGGQDLVLDQDRAVFRLDPGPGISAQALEALVRVSSPLGNVPLDFSHEGSVLVVAPQDRWVPGLRHRLTVTGLIRAEDGREIEAREVVTFWAIHREDFMTLRAVSPAHGVSVGPLVAGATILSLEFSGARGSLALEDHLSFSPRIKWEADWDPTGTLVQILAMEAAQPWTDYRWTLGRAWEGADGRIMDREWSGLFRTDLDQDLPEVEAVWPALDLGAGAWVDRGNGLESLEGLDPLAVVFSEAMDPLATEGALRLSPNLDFRTEWADPRTLILIPLDPWAPETAYTLTVSTEARDLGGLDLGEAWDAPFTTGAAPPWLSSLELSGGDSWLGGTDVVPLDMKLMDSVEGRASITLNLADIVPPEERSAWLDVARWEVYFPGNLPNPDLASIGWTGGNVLTVEWRGFVAASASSEAWYRLVLEPPSEDEVRILVEVLP